MYKIIDTIDSKTTLFPSWTHLINHLSMYNKRTIPSSYSNSKLAETGVNSDDIFHYYASLSDPDMERYDTRWRKKIIVERVSLCHYILKRHLRIVDDDGNNVYDWTLLKEVLNHVFDPDLEAELQAWWKKRMPPPTFRWRHYNSKVIRYRLDAVPYTGMNFVHYGDYYKKPRNHRKKKMAADPNLMIPYNREGNWKRIPDNWDDLYRHIDKSWKTSCKDKGQWGHNVRNHQKKADWYGSVE